MLYYVTQIPVTEDCLFTLDLKKDVGVIAIYFSNPFDSVCHNLLAMLWPYGCQESAIRLIRSSLSDRFERVTSNGFFWIATCGVSQGRLLVREFCTRHSFLLCRKYQFFSLKISTQTNPFLQICLRKISQVLPFSTPLFVDSRTILFLCHGSGQLLGPVCLQKHAGKFSNCP